MATTRELTPAEMQTVQVLNETLENIKAWENEIANPPDDGGWTPKLTPQGFQMVKVPGEGEDARVERLENNIYDAKAQALTTIEKNNAGLPEAERLQLKKESTIALYSDERSLELASDKNASMQRSPALSQEKDMALLAQEYRRQMNEPGAPSAGVRMSFPELFPQKGPEMSLEQLDIREIEFRQNAHEITGQVLPKELQGPEAQLQLSEPIQTLELPQASTQEMFLLNAPDITEPEPTAPGEDD